MSQATETAEWTAQWWTPAAEFAKALRRIIKENPL